MTTRHEKAVHIGDLADELWADACKTIVAVAIFTAPILVGYGAFNVAGELVDGMNPVGALLIQVFAGVVAVAVMALVIAGIDRFNRRTPTVVKQ